MSLGDARFDHLRTLTDDAGLHEHAMGTVPRKENGYCLDDVARGLVVLCREPALSPELTALTARYLAFTVEAQNSEGRFHNRLGPDQRWQDEPGLGDWWGRALWGLGTVAARAPDPQMRETSLDCFDISIQHRPPSVRSMAFAALGATEVLTVLPEHGQARAMLADAAAFIGEPQQDNDWPWPEHRLHYANAVIPEVLIAAGNALEDKKVLDDGLDLLGWLLAVESRAGHLSPTPVGGWYLGEPRPAFDQQPIEAAAIADACARGYALTMDRRWLDGVRKSVNWFLGGNDVRTPMHDPTTGGGYDGLMPSGRNENQGAESTLALISTLQHRRLL